MNEFFQQLLEQQRTQNLQNRFKKCFLLALSDSFNRRERTYDRLSLLNSDGYSRVVVSDVPFCPDGDDAQVRWQLLLNLGVIERQQERRTEDKS